MNNCLYKSTINFFLFLLLLFFYSCLEINEEKNDLTFQSSSTNYKWWSTQNNQEISKWSVRRDENIFW